MSSSFHRFLLENAQFYSMLDLYLSSNKKSPASLSRLIPEVRCSSSEKLLFLKSS